MTCNLEVGKAHSCIACGKWVHALDLCSIPLNGDEEGYGQRRTCLGCKHGLEETQSVTNNVKSAKQWYPRLLATEKRLEEDNHPSMQALGPRNSVKENMVKMFLVLYPHDKRTGYITRIR